MRGPRALCRLGRGWGALRGSRGLCTGALPPDNVVKSPYPDIQIPSVSVDEFVWKNLDRWANKTAVVCAQTGRKYSYSEVHEASGRVAQGLRARLGLGRGDVVAVMAPNVPEYCLAVLGAIRAGLVVTTLNPVYTPDEIGKQLKDSGAKAMITLSLLHPAADAARKGLNGSQRDMPIFTIKHIPTDVTPEGAFDFQELSSYSGKTVNLGRSSCEELAFLPYSSGTTGLPKGVQLTHKNVVSNLAQVNYQEIRLNLDTTAEWQDRVSAVLPMYHIYGLVLVFLNALTEGCQLVTLPRFTPELYHGMLLRHRPTMLYTAPPIVLFLNNFPGVKPEHVAGVRRVMCGAAPLSSADIDRFNEKFNVQGESKIVQGYGLTECSPLTHTQRAEVSTREGGIGWPIPNTAVRILSLEDDRTALGVGQTGQMAVKGPQVMKGYHNNEEATKETIDEDGWLRTGDIAHFNEDGQFHITDRLKELIKVKGFQVAPAELEAVLRNHPQVLEAAVTGVADARSGQAPRAYVVLRPGGPRLAPQDLQDHVARLVAPYKRLTGGVRFVQDIPKNPSGKILRRELQNLG